MARQQNRFGRREFLRTLGLGATAAVATVPLADQSRADTETKAERLKPRYRETDHVKAFYRVNRYPTK